MLESRELGLDLVLWEIRLVGGAGEGWGLG